jgi:pyridoxal 5'-phosphate synthase pdxS subunit
VRRAARETRHELTRRAENPTLLAKAIVEAVTHYEDPVRLAKVCTGLGRAMKGDVIPENSPFSMQHRGY